MKAVEKSLEAAKKVCSSILLECRKGRIINFQEEF